MPMPGRRTPQQQAGITATAMSMSPPGMHQQGLQQQHHQQRQPTPGTPVPGGPPPLTQARQMSPPGGMGPMNPNVMGAQPGQVGMNHAMGGAGAGAGMQMQMQMQGQPGMGGMGSAMGSMGSMSNMSTMGPSAGMAAGGSGPGGSGGGMPGATQHVLQQIVNAGPAAIQVYQQLQNPQNPMTMYLNQTIPGFSSMQIMDQMRRWQVVNVGCPLCLLSQLNRAVC